jgi:hypothetical protein
VRLRLDGVAEKHDARLERSAAARAATRHDEITDAAIAIELDVAVRPAPKYFGTLCFVRRLSSAFVASGMNVGFASRSSSWNRRRRRASPQATQITSCVVPCSSSASSLPAAWCSRSTFCVMRRQTWPRFCASASA